MHGVSKSNQEFGQRGCDFNFAQQQSAVRAAAVYEVRLSGRLQRVATLTFVLRDDGRVHVETDARGAALPAPTAQTDVTAEWAEKAADQVMIAVLKGQSTTAEDGDFMKGGFQTRVLTQPRSGRRRPSG